MSSFSLALYLAAAALVLPGLSATLTNTKVSACGTGAYGQRLSYVRSVTCEHSTAYLRCEEGQVIEILAADYGRHDKTTCSSGRPSSQVAKVDCSLSATMGKVAKICDGRSSCSVKASNSEFGDPCRGTFKYLQVHYRCGFRSVTCEHSTANLRCEEGRVIEILAADYGRHDKTTCSSGRPQSQVTKVDCTSPATVGKVAKVCNGKSSCSVSASNNVFGDPCHGTFKYLQTTYSCVLPAFRSVECEHSAVDLGCEEGQVIEILAADYGRHDKTTCSDGRPPSQVAKVDCTSPATVGKVANMCNGKSSCSVQASNSVFGDPCHGTFKYLQVDYRCGFRSVTCEHSTANLRCEEGRVIEILAADYGRHDKTTCSSGRPPSQVAKVDCTSPATVGKVAKMCNGRSSCSVKASNSEFADPCYGTFKYLEITYSCVNFALRSVECEHSTADLRCEEGQVMEILAADYGRHDKTTCSFGRPTSQITKVDCTSPAAKDKVAKMCDGRSSCSVKASNGVFGDPCGGTFKYLQVDYRCGYVPI